MSPPDNNDLKPFDIGSVIDNRYEIVEFLGEGGFATVYKARHIHINRMLAIKLLGTGVKVPQSGEFEQRFLREAQTAAQIDHVNVVTVHDFGFAGESRQPYIVMELLEGHDLEEEMKAQGPMVPQRAVRLFADCLDALSEAHDADIVHKDLKPSNLFLTHAGTDKELLQILDFGVASVNQENTKRLTSTGQILGTPAYLAPEYITERLSTPALDVYQMGLILIETLTATPLVMGDNPFQMLMSHCRAELEIPRALMNGPLGRVIERAISVDLSVRFADAGIFRTALMEVDARGMHKLTPAQLDDTVRPRLPEGYSLLDLRTEDGAVVEQAETLDSIEVPALTTGQLKAARAEDDAVAPVAAGINDTPQDDGPSDDGPILVEDAVPDLDIPVGGTNRYAFGIGLAIVALLGGLGIAYLIVGGGEDSAQAGSPQGEVAGADEKAGGEESEGTSKPSAAANETADDSNPGDNAAETGDNAVETGDNAAETGDNAAETGDNAAEVTQVAQVDDAAATPAEIRMFVASEPADAKVFRGDELLGTTPLVVNVDGANEMVTLRLEREGYEEREITEIVADGGTVNVALKKVRKRRPRDDKKGDDKKGDDKKDDDKKDDDKKDDDKKDDDKKGDVILIAP